MPVAQRSIDIDVPPARVMEVVTDFAAYPRFLADMNESTVLRTEPGGVWVVRFAVQVIRRVEYTLRLVKVSETQVRWSMVEGAFKANNGGWDLEPLDDGTRTRATYTLDLDLGMFVPGSVLKTLLEHNLPATLQAFKQRAEAGG